MLSPSPAKILGCLLIDRFNPLGAPRPRLEGVTEVLRLAKDLSIPELHDTDSVGRLPIITDDTVDCSIQSGGTNKTNMLKEKPPKASRGQIRKR
jgi:hypothetical protein